jgi:hypothetical protein
VTGTRLPALIVSKYESAIKNGIIVLLFHVGLAIGLAIAGLYMQSHQISVSTIAGLQSYPSADISYNWGDFISIYRIGIVFKETNAIMTETRTWLYKWN